MWLWIKTRVVAGLPTPLLQTFVAGPLLQTLVADLCVEYCSLQGACRGGVAEHPRLLQTFVAKLPHKPVTRPMFLIRCQMYVVFVCIYISIRFQMDKKPAQPKTPNFPRQSLGVNIHDGPQNIFRTQGTQHNSQCALAFLDEGHPFRYFGGPGLKYHVPRCLLKETRPSPSSSPPQPTKAMK